MNGYGSTRLKSLLTAVQRMDGQLQRLCVNNNSSMATPSTNTGRTAAILIIGDEILKGQTLETNSHLICKKLYNVGLKVKRISVISDDINEIADQVRLLSDNYDYVLTSGGVGPTHDDITYEGVAKAFDQKLVRHPSLVSLIAKYFGNDPAHPAYKMAEVPEDSQVLMTTDKPNRFPLVNVRNVYILPGVPAFLERSFLCFLDKLEAEGPAVAPNLKVLYVTVDEMSITPSLNLAVKQFKDRVSFGSYPSVTNRYYKVRITMEAEKIEDAMEAQEFLERELPEGSVLQYDPDPMSGAADKLYRALDDTKVFDPSFESYLRSTLSILHECIAKRYQPSEICISFNGGKDCTVLLHLYYAVLSKLFPDAKTPITALYIKCKNPFPEVEEFISECELRYKLKVCVYEGSIKDGLKEFLLANPKIKMILMGNRRTDPNATNLQAFQMTDSGWPAIMRVFPILDWSYKDVWQFIRHFQLSYCHLYDKGYSSLGSMDNTKHNPNLCEVDALGHVRYRPAYKLDEADSERDGRYSS